MNPACVFLYLVCYRRLGTFIAHPCLPNTMNLGSVIGASHVLPEPSLAARLPLCKIWSLGLVPVHDMWFQVQDRMHYLKVAGVGTNSWGHFTAAIQNCSAVWSFFPFVRWTFPGRELALEKHAISPSPYLPSHHNKAATAESLGQYLWRNGNQS